MKHIVPIRFRNLLSSLLALASLGGSLPAVFAQPAGAGAPPIEVTLRTRVIARGDFGPGGASVSQASTGFAAEVPFQITRDVNGKLGISLDEFRVDFENFNLTSLGTASPISRGRIVTVSPSFNFRPRDKVVVFAGPQWEFSGAKGADSGAAVQWSATVGALWFYRPDLTLVGGFVYSERHGYSTRYLPIAGFNWQIDDVWSLALTGSPADYQSPVLKLTRTCSPALKVYTQIGKESAYVRLAPDSPVPGGTQSYEAIVPSVGLEWRITPAFEATIFGGVQLAQEYEFKNRTRQVVLSESADSSMIFGLRLAGKF